MPFDYNAGMKHQAADALSILKPTGTHQWLIQDDVPLLCITSCILIGILEVSAIGKSTVTEHEKAPDGCTGVHIGTNKGFLLSPSGIYNRTVQLAF